MPFTLGDLAVHFESRQVTVAGRSVDLTATEYELLRVLALNAGRVVHYDTLLRQVWSGRSSADTNLVRIFVKSLRDKLGDSGDRSHLDLQRAGRRLPYAETRRWLIAGLWAGMKHGAPEGPTDFMALDSLSETYVYSWVA